MDIFGARCSLGKDSSFDEDAKSETVEQRPYMIGGSASPAASLVKMFASIPLTLTYNTTNRISTVIGRGTAHGAGVYLPDGEVVFTEQPQSAYISAHTG